MKFRVASSAGSLKLKEGDAPTSILRVRSNGAIEKKTGHLNS